MVLVLLPGVIVKAEGVVAKLYSGQDIQIGDENGYNTLQGAFAAAEAYDGEYPIVMLQQNVTVNEALTLNKDINLFLNGYVLTLGEGSSLTGQAGVSESGVPCPPEIHVYSGFSEGKEGSIVSSGNVDAAVVLYSNDVGISINGGTVGDITVYRGTINISGGTAGNIQNWGTANITGGNGIFDE